MVNCTGEGGMVMSAKRRDKKIVFFVLEKSKNQMEDIDINIF